MTNLTENSVWESGIYQLEVDDPTLGGQPGFNMGEPVTGHANAQAQQLANRTSYLKNRIDVDLASNSDPMKGSGMVGFLPEGDDVVGLTVQDVLRETVSARMFGAVGDNVSDDTVALNNLFEYCRITGKIAVGVAGDQYKISSTLNINCNADFSGCTVVAPSSLSVPAIKTSSATLGVEMLFGLDIRYPSIAQPTNVWPFGGLFPPASAFVIFRLTALKIDASFEYCANCPPCQTHWLIHPVSTAFKCMLTVAPAKRSLKNNWL